MSASTNGIEFPLAIEVRGLRKTYKGGVEALRGIDIRVEPGEVFGLLGPNGAGKSTTVGILTTTVTPSGGTARVAGYDVVRAPLRVRAASAVVFQDATIDRSLTGRRNLEIHGRLWGVPAPLLATRIAAAATQLGVAHLIDRPVSTYSGGERRRIEIVRAMLSEPQVLFLDEPTVGLDPRIRYELLDVVSGLRHQRRMTIVLTTHYLDEAERLCDRVAIIHQGSVVAAGAPSELLASVGSQVVELRVDADGADVLSTLRRRGAAGDRAFAVGGTITVPLADEGPDAIVSAAAATGASVVATTVRPPTLDDVYLRMTGTSLAA